MQKRNNIISFVLKLIKIFIISLFCYFFYIERYSTYAQNASGKQLPNVIIITLNGVRNKESIEDPTHQYIPNLWNKMFKEGVLYTHLVDLNFQFHMPTVNAINTGRIYPCFYDKVNSPTIFQYIRKKYQLPAYKFWFIGNWFLEQDGYATARYPEDTYPLHLGETYPLYLSSGFIAPLKLKYILTMQERIFLSLFRDIKNFTHYVNWSSKEEVSFQFLKKIIEKFKPKLIHYIMSGVECAHYDTYSQYVLSLKKSDEEIFKIWQLIKSGSFYKNKTYLIVCVDHDRNAYYMDHNENPPENPSRVWMYIYGPNIKKGKIIRRKIYHMDIFSTVAYIMDVETHATEGRILKDCFLKSR